MTQIASERDAFVVPLACLEPRRWADQQFGMPRTGSHWARFRSESLKALCDLIARGSGLRSVQKSLCTRSIE